MPDKPPPYPLDYHSPQPGEGGAWVILPFIGGAILGFVAVFSAVLLFFVSGGGPLSVLLSLLVIAVPIGLMIWGAKKKRRRLTPFEMGCVAGIFAAILAEGVCFAAIANSNI